MGIMASIAEFYSQNLATEVMKGMRQKASNGGTPGRAPLGYLNERRFDDDGREIRTIVIDPDRGPHITWAFRAYASGEWSITRLAAVLNDRGMTTKPGPNTQAQPLTARSVHHLLRNAYYQGTVTFNGVEHPGRHEPLIDPVTWAAVQDMLAAHRNGERSRVHDHYLKGTVFCFECGRRLIVQSTQTKSGRVYDYFVCHRRRDSTCTQRKALHIAIVEQRVEDLYRSIQLSPQQRKRVEQVALASLRRRQTINVERLDSLAEQATAVETNRTKLLNAYYAEALPRDLFLAEQRRLTAERARLDRERRRTETDRASLEAQVRDALDLLEDAHATYASASATVRKQLNRTIFAGVFLSPESPQIRSELNEPFAGFTTDPGASGND
ncbi:recombinase family protein [Tessaracoccus lacteus]|uniref:Recombinase family protein n=1 Tax=Tessaracoccus lacteus TaxID=3041766 RepID=A0ABY8PWE7_9ACTN|nr:recombinase family protein [Tessaracoccus sp. T21]WGT46748.1 recombinase family protein [Tessaracoccus sp. T21]